MSNGPKPPPPPAKKPAAPPPTRAADKPPSAPAEAPEQPLQAEPPAPPAAPPEVPAAAPESTDLLAQFVGDSPAPPPSRTAAPRPAEGDAGDPLAIVRGTAERRAPKIKPDIPFGQSSPLAGIGIGGSEIDDEIKKIGRGSVASKVVFGAIALTILGIGGFAFWSSQRFNHRFDRLGEIDQMTDQAQVVPALVEELRNTTYPDVKQRILANLGHFAKPETVPAIIEQLQYEGVVRREAAHALASIGLPAAEPAKQALLDVLPQTTARDRGQVIWTLCVLGESRAADAIIEAFGRGELQNMEGFEPKRIARVVGVQRLSAPALINHNSNAVRLLVAVTLGEVATPEAAAPLRDLLTQELARPADQRSMEILRAAASGLGRTGSPDAAQPLFRVLTQEPGIRGEILNALGRTTAAPQLAQILGLATDEAIRRDLTKLLEATHDPRAADALAGQLGSSDLETRAHAALGLAELGDARALPVLSELSKLSDHDELRRGGLAGLAYVASPNNTRQLIALMNEVPTTKASVLRALGRSGDRSVAPVLLAEIEGPDGEPAAYALGELNDDGAFSRVLQLAKRPQNVNMAAQNDVQRNSANQALLMSRRSAIIALGRYGRPAAFETLSTIVEDAGDDYELRSRAGQSLGQVASIEQINQIIAKVRTAGVPNDTREYYAQALWQRPRPELTEALLGLVASALPDSLRTSAAVAVGYAADPAAQPRLLEMLGQDDNKRFAAIALGMMGDEAAIEQLKDVLARNQDLASIFRQTMDPEGDSAVQGNRISVLTTAMFESGAVYRRMSTAWYLKAGTGDRSLSYAWTRLAALLKLGYDGAGGATAHDIRGLLWTAISTNPDPNVRIMVGRMLLELRERGILLRARDTEGPTEDAARFVLREAAAREAAQANGGAAQ